MPRKKFVGYDIETVQRDATKADTDIISYAVYRTTRDHEVYTDSTRNIDPAVIEEVLKEFVGKGFTIAAHSLFYDLCKINYTPPVSQVFCTLVAAGLLDERGENSLESLAQEHLGTGKVEGLDRRNLLKYPDNEIAHYNLVDAKLHADLAEVLERRLEQADLMPLFRHRMQTLLNLVETHRKGLPVDLQKRQEAIDHYTEIINKAQSKLQKFASPKFNHRSTAQVLQLLQEWGTPLDLFSMTATGNPSTDAGTLRRIQREGPEVPGLIAGFILDLRQAEKLLNTYVIPFGEKYMYSDQHMRPFFHVGKGTDQSRTAGTSQKWSGGAGTGRLSSSRPNGQNIARQTIVKNIVRAPDGCLFGEADYSQIEIRFLGALSNDEVIMDAFRQDMDFHTATLSKIYGMHYADAVKFAQTPEGSARRTEIKEANFCPIYGGGAKTIYENLRTKGVKITLAEAYALHDSWYDIYRGFASWKKLVEEHAQYTGTVTTVTGVVRHLLPRGVYNWYDMPEWKRQACARQAVNTIVQNAAAELTYDAFDTLCENGIDCRNTVHDSVLFAYSRKWIKTRRQRYMFGKDVLRLLEHVAVNKMQERIGDSLDLANVYVKADLDIGMTHWGGKPLDK